MMRKFVEIIGEMECKISVTVNEAQFTESRAAMIGKVKARTIHFLRNCKEDPLPFRKLIGKAEPILAPIKI